MEGVGFHPPKFSEDPAWLPPWLQPEQLPFVDDRINCDQVPSQPLSMKSSSYLFRSGGKDHSLLAEEDNRRSGCHLFLSGEDDSPLGSTPSSRNTLLFDLHLSSEGISQIPSNQSFNELQIGSVHINNDLPKKFIIQKKIPNENQENMVKVVNEESLLSKECMSGKHEVAKEQSKGIATKPSFQKVLGCNLKMFVKAARNEISSPGMPAESSSYITKKIKKLDLSDADEAVELSIAASEAVAISELAGTCSSSELLQTDAILEVAVRVRQACNDFLSEDANTSVAHKIDEIEIDEIDSLSDLDDNAMADAFDDVGLFVAQIISFPDISLPVMTSLLNNKEHSGNSDIAQESARPSCEDTPSESHSRSRCSLPQTCGLEFQNLIVDTSVSYDDLRSTHSDLPSVHFVQQVECPTDSNMISIKSKRRVPSKACTNNLNQANENDVVPARFACGERGPKGDEATARDNFIGKKSVAKLFIAETSFISESLVAAMDDSMSVQRPDIGPDVVASSSSFCQDTHQMTLHDNEYREDELLYPRDVVGSSNHLPSDPLSSASTDPFCSIVPCSISSGDKEVEDTAGKCLGTNTAAVQFPKPLSNKNEVAPSFDIQVTALTDTRPEGSAAIRKWASSLKFYSTVMPTKNSNLVGSADLLHNNFCCLTSNFENAEAAILQHKANQQGATVPRNISDIISNNDKTDEYSPFQDRCPGSRNLDLKQTELCVDHFQLPSNQDGEMCTPSLLRNRKRRLIQACNSIPGSETEFMNVKLYSVSKSQSYRQKDAVVDASFNDTTVAKSSLAKEHDHLNKRVHFADDESSFDHNNLPHNLPKGRQSCFHARFPPRAQSSCLLSLSKERGLVNNCITRLRIENERAMLFYGLQFLLTGFSKKKKEEVELSVKTHGGIVIPTIPETSRLKGRRVSLCSFQWHPILLAPKKVQTTKFLFGCAINTWVLNATWISDCVKANCILSPEKYLILSTHISWLKNIVIGKVPSCCVSTIFDRMGAMLYGKTSFCSKYSIIIKHGGGQVFKTIKWLVQSLKSGKNSIGVILVHDENSVSRHLKHCALEHNLHTMPASWIVDSLFCGKLLPLKKDCSSVFHKIKMPKFSPMKTLDMSQEI